MDRIAPSVRPSGPNAGTQRWESLLFCHWELPINDVRACLPPELELDTFDGRAFVGVVPFKMRNIRPRWTPKFFGMNFLETNVRTYVIHKGKPGVYFFSLDASSRLAVWAARAGWSLPYFYAKMKSYSEEDSSFYQSVRPNGNAANHVRFSVGNELGPSKPDTLEHFLCERYLLFVKRRERIYVGQVHHEPYQIFDAKVVEATDRLLVASTSLPETNRGPDLAHFSPAVDVEVFAIKPD